MAAGKEFAIIDFATRSLTEIEKAGEQVKFGQKCSYDFETQYEDIDCGGGVHNPNYLKYFERARNFHLTEIGFPQSVLLGMRFALVLSEVNVKFVKPAFIDSQFKIYTEITRANNLSLLVEQAIFKREADPGALSLTQLKVERPEGLICRASTRMVSVNLDRLRPAKIFAELARAMEIPEDTRTLGLSDTSL